MGTAIGKPNNTSECKPSMAVDISKCKHNHTTVNATDAADLKKGDLIKFFHSTSPCWGFYHWAIYIGDNLIVHVTLARKSSSVCQCPDDKTFLEGNTLPTCPSCREKYKAAVRCDALDTWCHGESFTVCNCFDKKYRPLPTDEIEERARAALGPVAYHFKQYNCEHFAYWCRYNIAASFQSTWQWTTADAYLQKVKKGAGVARRTVNRVVDISSCPTEEMNPQKTNTENHDTGLKPDISEMTKERKMNRPFPMNNFLITVAAGFTVGYKGIEMMVGKDFPLQMMSGLIVATFVFFVALHFLARWMRAGPMIDQPPALPVTQQGKTPDLVHLPLHCHCLDKSSVHATEDQGNCQTGKIISKSQMYEGASV